MEHQYEYITLVDYLAPIALGGSPAFTDKPARIALAKAFGEFCASIPEVIDKLPDNKDWEINSHSLTFAGTTVMVSILLQRNRK